MRNGNAPIDSEGTAIDISVVIPVYNEEKNVTILYGEINDALGGRTGSYEVIFVNDGSTDGTLSELKRISGGGRLRILDLERNYGQTAAIKAGFDAARGDVIVTMDGDLQNDPRDILPLAEKLDEGYDLVVGWRRKRKDPFFSKVLPSISGNAVIAFTLDTRIHDLGCTLKAYRRQVVEKLELFGQMHRFIPALAALKGARVAEMEVHHRPRIHGKTKYGFSRALRVLSDLLVVAYLSGKGIDPVVFSGSLAATAGAAGLATLLAAFASGASASGRAAGFLAVFSVLFFLASFQFIIMAFMALSSVRAYRRPGGKAIYRIRQTI